MACTDYTAYWEFWRHGQFFDAVSCPFVEALGGPLFAMLVFGPALLGMYIYSGSIILPLVLTLILGSVVVVQLPSVALQLFGIVILLSIAGAGYLLVQRSEGLP